MMQIFAVLIERPWQLLAAMLLVCTFPVQAQSMRPGEWQYWKNDALQAPRSTPALQICLNATQVQSPLALIGDPPSDSDCKASNIRKRGDVAVDFDLVCQGRGKYTASTTLSGNGSVLVTQVVPVSGNPPNTKITYVHGKWLQSCTP